MLKIEKILRNEKGKNVLKDSFDEITIKSNAVIVKKDGQYGVYNMNTFQKILECVWDKIALNGEFILAHKYSQIALFKFDGSQILQCEWKSIVLYERGILATKNELQGFFAYDGTVILECVWKRIEPFHEVLVAYRGKGSKRILFDYQGNPQKNN